MSKKNTLKFPKDFLVRCYTQDRCIIMTGTPSSEYGRYRGQQAHRYAYELHRGPIPEGYVVHHTCFCKRCVNPDHLEAISQRDNVRENLRQGRMAHLNKLTPAQVIDICRDQKPLGILAEKYAVSVTTINRIKRLYDK